MGPRVVRRVDPADLFPADLDLVARVDLARMRSELGPDATSRLAARALAETGESDGSSADLLARAVAQADVVWLGARLGQLARGDRVVIAEGHLDGLAPSEGAFRKAPSALGGVDLFDAAGHPSRDGVARVIVLGGRAIAFVSPVEVDAVDRVLRDGPDRGRGDPTAEGIVSLDVRVRPLPPALEARFPSIGAIVAGIERVRAVVTPDAGGLRLDAEIVGRTAEEAARAQRFLDALRANTDEGPSAVLRALEVERTERTVRARWPLPPQARLEGLGSGPQSPSNER